MKEFRIEKSNDTIFVYSPYKPEFIKEIKKIPGRKWNPEKKRWEVPIKYENEVKKLIDKCIESDELKKKGYNIRCPVCGQMARLESSSSQKGFKGTKYSMTVYEHPDKECVVQEAYYPNYFGRPKVKVYKWSREK
jgi:hypothetical protein